MPPLKQYDLSYSDRKTIYSWSHKTPPSPAHEMSLDDPIYKPQRSVTNEQAILNQEFRELAQTWRRQKGGISSISRKVSIPSYLRIIGLGSEIIPLILEELQRQPDHWFVALEALTNANPVSESEHADFNQTVAAWLRWGRERGHI